MRASWQGGGVYINGGTVSFELGRIFSNTAFVSVLVFLTFQDISSIAPMEFQRVHNASTLLFQGGGVYISGGTVNVFSSNIYSNTAEEVRLPLRPTPFHGRHGRSFQEVSLALAGWWHVRCLWRGCDL